MNDNANGGQIDDGGCSYCSNRLGIPVEHNLNIRILNGEYFEMYPSDNRHKICDEYSVCPKYISYENSLRQGTVW